MSERGSGTLRTLDRYAGIPLVAAAGVVRRKRTPPAEIRRVGVLKAYAIGDTVLLSAIVRDLATALPEAEIVFFSGLDNVTTAELVDGVSSVVSVPISRPWLTVRPTRCTSWRTTGGSSSRSGSRSTSLPRLEPPNELPPDAVPDGDYVVFHLWPGGYRSELKEWPLDRWRELAEALTAEGFAVVLTGGRDDFARTEAFARECGSLARPVANAAGRFTIREVLDFLARSSGVVSVNTGTMHLAAAVGAPTVALNGPTAERRWGPLGERALSVNSTYGGCGYLNLGSEYAGSREDCMLGISVTQVLDATGALLGFAAPEPA